MATLYRKDPSHATMDLTSLFDWMAPRYVRQTTLVSWGRYPRWMRKLAHRVAALAPESVLDVGCGPGILLGHLKTLCPECTLLGLDPSTGMLALVPSGIPTMTGRLPGWSPDDGRRFDVAVLSFVLRDLSEPVKALAAVRQVLQPGGRLVVMETQAPEGWSASGFDLYFHHWLPRWGALALAPDFSGPPDQAPYRWLSDTQRDWHRGERFAQWVKEAGFADSAYEGKPQDVVGIWSARL